VFEDRAANYWQRTSVLRKTAPIVGDGLFLSDGGAWLRQRRMLAPRFAPDQVGSLAALMTRAIGQRLERWTSAADAGQAVDVAPEMWQMAGTIIVRAMFGATISDEVCAKFIRAADVAVAHVERQIKYLVPSWAPLPGDRACERALRALDRFIYRHIAARRRDGQSFEDLLATLVQLRDSETGDGLSDRELRDEAMTLFITGQQPVALALSWLWYLVSQDADVRGRLEAEVDAVVGDREPTLDDVPQLIYARAVIAETLRLYPPVYVFFRTAFAADEIAGYHIPAKAVLSFQTYATHRDPAYWEDPDRFDPGRFLGAPPADRPAYAYFPFGGGPRECLGRHVGMLEMTLAVAMVTQRYRLHLRPGADVRPNAIVLLGLTGPVPMLVTRRRADACP
jgi:cytochrome P450